MSAEDTLPKADSVLAKPFYENKHFALVVYWGLLAGLLAFGGILTFGGALLVLAGGSFYYIVAGLLQLAAMVQLFRRKQSAIHLYVVYFVLTWFWALTEVGFNGWGLLPRVNMACLLMPFILLPALSARLEADRLSLRFAKFRPYYFKAGLGWVGLVVAVICINALLADHYPVPAPTPKPSPAQAVSTLDGEWRSFGQNLSGQRFSPANQITRANVKDLTLAWEYVAPAFKSDPAAAGGAPDAGPSTHAPGRRDEATPLLANGKLYICNPESIVTTLDAETGKLLWRFDPHIDTTGIPSRLCRGLAYYEDAQAKTCQKRIVWGTLDLRLMAIDAETGKPCSDFGKDGAVSLRTGLGDFPTGYYYPTSPPTIVNGVAVIGAMVRDNETVGEPSGVIRGFDVHTGKLVWAWDMGRPESETGEPKPGERYTPGTPNSWTIFSGDEKLGLVYIPTGNGTPDFVGSHRKPEWEKYSSAVVALDVKTGKVRWVFQTVHHDLWDYDIASQPVLYDLPTPKGTVPALIQATKQGQLFVLDRRTGVPISKVIEKPVPQTDVPGEWTAKTQPHSVDMPNLVGPRLRESDMWGVTPFDQLLCRVMFKKLRYEGSYTPPSLSGSIQYPGLTGGSSWGSVTIDRERNLLIAPSSRLSTRVKLFKRELNMGPIKHTEPQRGTPYLVDANVFFTPLYVPCQAPPYGLLTAIDLTTRKTVWEKPLGTAEELGPRGLKSYLPFNIGTAPIVGGAIATSGDVIFIGAAADRKLRAIDTLTGRVLWSQRLPEGSQATPITYRAPKSGRQMVVIVSGGRVDLLRQKDFAMHVVAYALPQ